MNINKTAALLFVFLVFTCTILCCQNLTHFHYGLENGLSQETIRTITKDDNGFLWIGTQDGLNRFDGNVFTVYKNDKNDPLSLHENYINTLFHSSDKKLWVGTATYGVSYYDGKTDSFYKVGLEKGNCTGFAETKDHHVFAAFLNGELSVFSFKNGTVNHRSISFFKDRNLQLTSIAHDAENDTLFIATKDGRLFKAKLEGANFTAEEIVFNKHIGSINTFAITKSNLWIGTSTGLYFCDKTKNQLIKYEIETPNGRTNNSNLFVEVIKAFNNTLYLGTDYGYYELTNFDSYTGVFEETISYFGDQKEDSFITSNRVYDILVDNRFIWIGTNKLDAISQEKPVFNLINTKTKTALNNDHVFSILKTKKYLFLGTRNGLNCIDTNGNVTVITKESTQNKLAYNVIRHLAIDHENNLWLATTKGVSVISLIDFNPKSPKIKSMYHNASDNMSLSNDKTRGLYLDHNNTMWVTTYGGGINRFTGNLKNDEFTFEHFNNLSNQNSLSSDITFNILQDRDKTYWITTDIGLNTLNFDSNYTNPIFKNYVNDPTDKTTLNNNGTLHTYIDSKGTLWIATQDGFHKYLGKETFKRYGKEDGLSNSFVYGILEDINHDLWLSTNAGLFRFNPTTETFTNFTVNDGLQSSEFNLGAQFNDTVNNTLYFGGVNGYNYFNPNDVDKLDLEGTLKFTSLKIRSEKISPVQHPEIISKNITTSKSITLNYDDFPTNLTFSELDFRGNKNNQFVYKLLPNNTTWSNLNASQDLQLIGLSKGEYTLQIQGKSRNNLWQKPPLELTINVTPPWYKSNLAYLFYLLFFLGIVYAFYTIRLQRQIAGQESKRLQDLDDLKSRFITNITHEFRTPLTIILGYLGNLKERFSNKEDDVNTSFNTIEQNSNNLLNLVNQMLDLAKLEQGKLSLKMVNDDLLKYIEYIINSFSSIAKDKHIDLNFESNQESLFMDFDTEKTRQILTNLISNAIKFSSENSKITIAVAKQDNNVIIKVSDQGLGIPEDELPNIFDRFFQVKNNEHKVSQGTGIGLALTKELILLLDGTIHVDSQIHKGTTFTVKLPIQNTAKATPLEFESKHSSIGKTYVPKLGDSITINDTNSVLIVEDNTDMARYIASCLQPNYKVSFAENGQEGFEKAQELIPDIIITDVMMPIMDGFELTQKLQSHRNTNHIPIVMLTSKAMQEDKLEGILSGTDAYLTKPFQKQELLLRMQMLISKRQKLQTSYAVEKLKEQPQQKAPDKNLLFLNTVVEVIHKHLEDSDFNATQLAKVLAMSDSQLYRKLKAISNSSTSIFIRKVRLEKSKELLKTTHLPVSEVAYASGFNDPNWFSKAFKEAYSMSPTDFRN
jgi:signal transduction histidine kinase/ligand-binding sensor domain-containing protein/DNA-binding response OmpR family regulator